MYAPTIGRFISADPIGLAGGDENLYRYVDNDPINAFDPSGLGPEWHHLLPREAALQGRFQKLGFMIDEAQWGWILDDKDHDKLHPRWNAEWKKWFNAQKGKITAEMVKEQLNTMKNDPRFKPYLSKGAQAVHDFKYWQKQISAAGKEKLFKILKHIGGLLFAILAPAIGGSTDACAAMSPVLAFNDEALRKEYEAAIKALQGCDIAAAQRLLFDDIKEPLCFLHTEPRGLVCKLLKKYNDANEVARPLIEKLEVKLKAEWVERTKNLKQELRQLGNAGCK